MYTAGVFLWMSVCGVFVRCSDGRKDFVFLFRVVTTRANVMIACACVRVSTTCLGLAVLTRISALDASLQSRIRVSQEQKTKPRVPLADQKPQPTTT